MKSKFSSYNNLFMLKVKNIILSNANFIDLNGLL